MNLLQELREALANTLSLAALKYDNTDDIAAHVFAQARAAIARLDALGDALGPLPKPNWYGERVDGYTAATLEAWGQRAALLGAVPQGFSARPLEWGNDNYTGQWVDEHHGFAIVQEPTGETPYCASWGEGDAEEFATLEEAKAWCQRELDAWVRRYVIAAPQPQQEPR